MDIYILIVGFVCHYVGDFLLQTRKIAMNKSKSIKYLSLHGLPILATSLVVMSLYDMTFAKSALCAIVYTLAHCLQDYKVWGWFNTAIASKHERGSEEFDKWFFRFLGFDQMAHMILLFGIPALIS